MDFSELEAKLDALFLGPVRGRIVERAKRGAELRSWAVTLKDPPPGSSMQLDNEGFLPEIGSTLPVAQYARFPVSSAAEHLAAANVLVSDWFDQAVPPPKESPSWPSSVLVLCRSAMEAAARTIWLIEAPSREVRRQRCAAEASRELEEMLKWGKQNRDAEIAEGQDVSTFEDSAADLKTTIGATKAAKGEVTAPGFTAMTIAGAAWIDANPPKHARTDLDGIPFELRTKASYSIGSSYTHGYHWTLNILTNQKEQYSLVADQLMSAVLMTETAIALFEAQMLAPDEPWRNEHLPARLGPTIADWASRYRESS